MIPASIQKGNFINKPKWLGKSFPASINKDFQLTKEAVIFYNMTETLKIFNKEKNEKAKGSK
jgi:hypothetical protein